MVDGPMVKMKLSSKKAIGSNCEKQGCSSCGKLKFSENIEIFENQEQLDHMYKLHF